MPGRWFRRSREPGDDAQFGAAQAALTAAFLDMENRRNVVESLFAAAAAVEAQPSLEPQFDAVRNVCYDATAAYLSATGSDSDGTTGSRISYQRTTATERAQQLIDSARQGLDQFHERHRATMDAVAARGVAAEAEAAAATAEADNVAHRLAQTADALRAYPSVQRASDELTAAYGDLQAVRAQRSVAPLGEASRRLRAAVRSVAEALDAAPQLDGRAHQTVASLRTRLDALRNRVDSVDANRSALLREFHANSSKDLLDNGPASRNHLDRADGLLARAVAVQREHQPEAVLSLATQARAELSAAEERIDAVADRLAMLRELRKDPASKEKEVRFRLRDAQRLAVDRGVAKEWGTALDAQATRIDLLVNGLGVAHPDYWGYYRGLEDVSHFIATIVTRIRQRAAK